MSKYKAGMFIGPYDTLLLEDAINEPPKGQAKGLFKCSFCGQDFKANCYEVKIGRTRGCGCLQSKMKYHAGDIVGKYDTLLISDCWREKNHTYCKAKCSFCGKIFTTRIDGLVSGTIKSCGCYSIQALINYNKNQFVDLSGSHFGKLTVLKSKENEKKRKSRYLCRCECGKEVIVERSNLISGRTCSCGSCVLSKGNLLIESYLNDNKIVFIKEKTFEDCRNPKTERRLRFDFYLPDYNCCIEYDGEQHYKGWYYDKENLKQNQYRDQIKNEYCENKNIKLIRIPYWEISNIDNILSERIF